MPTIRLFSNVKQYILDDFSSNVTYCEAIFAERVEVIVALTNSIKLPIYQRI